MLRPLKDQALVQPNLFVIGAMKAGTTALYNYLACHPSIYMSPVKEPNFFSDDLWSISQHIASGSVALVERAKRHLTHNALITDEAVYRSLYPNERDGYIYFGEASPSYLRSESAALRIRNQSPDAKIIAILRDPIDRLWSHYLMERNEARAPDDFVELVDLELEAFKAGRRTQHGFLESSLYYSCLRRYVDAFGEQRVLVLDQADLRDSTVTLAMLARFLAIDGSEFAIGAETANPTTAARFPVLNRVLAASGVKQAIRRIVPQSLISRFKPLYYGASAPSSTMPYEARERLRRFYSADVAELAALLGVRAPSWTDAYRDLL